MLSCFRVNSYGDEQNIIVRATKMIYTPGRLPLEIARMSSEVPEQLGTRKAADAWVMSLLVRTASASASSSRRRPRHHALSRLPARNAGNTDEQGRRKKSDRVNKSELYSRTVTFARATVAGTAAGGSPLVAGWFGGEFGSVEVWR